MHKERAREKIQKFKEFLEYLKHIIGKEEFVKIEKYLISAYTTGVNHATQMILALPGNEGIEYLLAEAANLEMDITIKEEG